MVRGVNLFFERRFVLSLFVLAFLVFGVSGIVSAAACMDTDGGRNYGVIGTVSNDQLTFTDYCIDSQTLMEYDCGVTGGVSSQDGCSHNGLGSCDYVCQYGCSAGRCLSAQTTSTTTTTSKFCTCDSQTTCAQALASPLCSEVRLTAGFYAALSVPNNKILDCQYNYLTFDKNVGPSFVINVGNNGTVKNCNIIEANLAYGALGAINVVGENSTIVHNYIVKSGSSGIQVAGGTNNISFNRLENGTSYGINVISTGNANYKNKHIISENYVCGYAEDVLGDPVKNIYSKNTCQKTQRDGVFVQGVEPDPALCQFKCIQDPYPGPLCTCDSQTTCNAALMAPGCQEVKLTKDISRTTTELSDILGVTVRSFGPSSPAYFKDKTFDCQSHKITGMTLGMGTNVIVKNCNFAFSYDSLPPANGILSVGSNSVYSNNIFDFRGLNFQSGSSVLPYAKGLVLTGSNIRFETNQVFILKGMGAISGTDLRDSYILSNKVIADTTKGGTSTTINAISISGSVGNQIIANELQGQIYISSGAIGTRNNILEKNNIIATKGSDLSLVDYAGLSIDGTGNIIKENEIFDAKYSGLVIRGSNMQVIENTVTGTRKSITGGISENALKKIQESIGLEIYSGSSGNTFTNNYLCDNEKGIRDFNSNVAAQYSGNTCDTSEPNGLCAASCGGSNTPNGCTPNWQFGSTWSACVNGQQTRTASDANNCGDLVGKPGDQTQSCVSSNTCTSFTYSAWSACVNGQQTRTVSSSSPSGCTGGSPVVSKSCTACTSNSECTSGQQCTNGVCTTPVTTTPRINRAYFAKQNSAGAFVEVESNEVYHIGNSVYVVVETQNIDDDSIIDFEIYENDFDAGLGFSDDEIRVGDNKLSAIVENGRAVVEWEISDDDYDLGNDDDSEELQFYAKAIFQSDDEDTGDLKVSNGVSLNDQETPVSCGQYSGSEAACLDAVVPQDEAYAEFNCGREPNNVLCQCGWNAEDEVCELNIVDTDNGGSGGSGSEASTCSYPVISESACVDGTRTIIFGGSCGERPIDYPCASAIVLPFFGIVQLMIAVLAITLSYIFIRRFRFFKF